MTLYILRF